MVIVQVLQMDCYFVSSTGASFIVEFMFCFLDYKGPLDDVIIFAAVAQHHGIPLHVLNTDFYGFMPVPMESHNSLAQEKEQFTHIVLESISK